MCDNVASKAALHSIKKKKKKNAGRTVNVDGFSSMSTSHGEETGGGAIATVLEPGERLGTAVVLHSSR